MERDPHAGGGPNDLEAALAAAQGAGAGPAAEPRPHRPRSSAVAILLALLGLAFLVVAFVPAALDFAERNFGFQRIVAAALGFLFLYVAWAARENGRFRERVLDMVEGVLQIFYGPNFRRERQAIDILVSAMESDNASVRGNARQHLARLTGRDLGDDARAWADWWAGSRATFRSPGSSATAAQATEKGGRGRT